MHKLGITDRNSGFNTTHSKQLHVMFVFTQRLLGKTYHVYSCHQCSIFLSCHYDCADLIHIFKHLHTSFLYILTYYTYIHTHTHANTHIYINICKIKKSFSFFLFCFLFFFISTSIY